MEPFAIAPMPGMYLAAILLSFTGVILTDYRWKLAWFSPLRNRVLAVVPSGVALFLLWDLIAIATGVFFRGPSEAYLGISLAPELPLEEVFFLTFLCYLSIVLWRGVERALRMKRS